MSMVKKQFSSIAETQDWLKSLDIQPYEITVTIAEQKKAENEPKNAMVRALYKHIEETGGLKHGEEILKLGQDFRDSFYFEKD